MGSTPTQNRSSRSARSTWILLGCAAALLVLLLMPTQSTTRGLAVYRDLAHVGMGALFALALRSFLQARGLGPNGAALLAFVLTTGLLGLMELVQPIVGRSASWADVGGAAVGAAAALLAERSARLPDWRRAATATGALALVAFACYGPIRTWLDIGRRESRLPLLTSFEEVAELDGWSTVDATIERKRGYATHGAFSLEATLRPGPFPSVSFKWAPHDWRGYEALAFDVDLQGSEAFDLLLKVEDIDHDFAPEFRSITRLRLTPGVNAIRVPLEAIRRAPRGGDLNLARIAGLVFMAVDLDTPRTVRVDHLRLERGRAADGGGPGLEPSPLAPRSR